MCALCGALIKPAMSGMCLDAMLTKWGDRMHHRWGASAVGHHTHSHIDLLIISI